MLDDPMIGPYEQRSAVCRDYDPRAPAVASQIAATIRSHLPQVQVEHIGSTAVPGCAGKGIVDLMVPFRDAEELAAVQTLLEQLGFQRQATSAPFPEDRPMRVGSLVYEGDVFLVHVHVIPATSPEVDEIRFFRTCLRADPELLRAYIACKEEIVAAGITDSLDYCRRKGEFIKAVLG